MKAKDNLRETNDKLQCYHMKTLNEIMSQIFFFVWSWIPSERGSILYKHVFVMSLNHDCDIFWVTTYLRTNLLESVTLPSGLDTLGRLSAIFKSVTIL